MLPAGLPRNRGTSLDALARAGRVGEDLGDRRRPRRRIVWRHAHRCVAADLGQRIATEGGTSDATVHAIEDETRRVIGEALAVASDAVNKNRGALEHLVAALLEKETLERTELELVLGEVPVAPDASRREQPPSLSVAPAGNLRGVA